MLQLMIGLTALMSEDLVMKINHFRALYEFIVMEHENMITHHATGPGWGWWSETWVRLTLIWMFHHLAKQIMPSFHLAKQNGRLQNELNKVNSTRFPTTSPTPCKV